MILNKLSYGARVKFEEMIPTHIQITLDTGLVYWSGGIIGTLPRSEQGIKDSLMESQEQRFVSDKTFIFLIP